MLTQTRYHAQRLVWLAEEEKSSQEGGGQEGGRKRQEGGRREAQGCKFLQHRLSVRAPQMLPFSFCPDEGNFWNIFCRFYRLIPRSLLWRSIGRFLVNVALLILYIDPTLAI